MQRRQGLFGWQGSRLLLTENKVRDLIKMINEMENQFFANGRIDLIHINTVLCGKNHV